MGLQPLVHAVAASRAWGWSRLPRRVEGVLWECEGALGGQGADGGVELGVERRLGRPVRLACG
eukprot:scaffold18896_cov36-Phaeocystis_antarctica.AAC.1